MFASQVRFYGEEHLDSAGMVISGDGSSKQRGHLFPVAEFDREEEVLLPSASAALYRRTMLEEVGIVRRGFFSLLRGYRSRFAGALGGMEMHLCAGRRGRSPLLSLGGARFASQGVLRGTQPAVCRAEKFSGRNAVRGAFCERWCVTGGMRGRSSWAAGRRRSFAEKEIADSSWCGSFFARTGACLRHARSLWRKRRDIRRRAKLSAADFATIAAGAFDSSAQGGGAVMTPDLRAKLMILVPAFNEEGAIGERGGSPSSR